MLEYNICKDRYPLNSNYTTLFFLYETRSYYKETSHQVVIRLRQHTFKVKVTYETLFMYIVSTHFDIVEISDTII